MSYQSDKTDGMLWNDPEDMTDHELGLALYHIGANTMLSYGFTVDFVNRVTLRASQLLYSGINEVEAHASRDTLDSVAESHLRGEWSIIDDDGDWGVAYGVEIEPTPITIRYPEFKDGKLSQKRVKFTFHDECTCDACNKERDAWVRSQLQ